MREKQPEGHFHWLVCWVVVISVGAVSFSSFAANLHSSTDVSLSHSPVPLTITYLPEEDKCLQYAEFGSDKPSSFAASAHSSFVDMLPASHGDPPVYL